MYKADDEARVPLGNEVPAPLLRKEITVGAMIRPKFRNLLKALSWHGYTIEYEELKGFLTSTFLIKVDEEGNKVINDFAKELNEL